MLIVCAVPAQLLTEAVRASPPENFEKLTAEQQQSVIAEVAALAERVALSEEELKAKVDEAIIARLGAKR